MLSKKHIYSNSLGENRRNISPRGEELLLLGCCSFEDAQFLLWVMLVSKSRQSKEWIELLASCPPTPPLPGLFELLLLSTLGFSPSFPHAVWQINPSHKMLWFFRLCTKRSSSLTEHSLKESWVTHRLVFQFRRTFKSIRTQNENKKGIATILRFFYWLIKPVLSQLKKKKMNSENNKKCKHQYGTMKEWNIPPPHRCPTLWFVAEKSDSGCQRWSFPLGRIQGWSPHT